jgi:hypothetical protein
VREENNKTTNEQMTRKKKYLVFYGTATGTVRTDTSTGIQYRYFDTGHIIDNMNSLGGIKLS